MFNIKATILFIFFICITLGLKCQSFDGLPEMASEKVKKWAVRFDFENNSCYPAAAISFDGKVNEGHKASGLKTGNCRNGEQLTNANTFCRTQSVIMGSDTFEIIMYALYFEKDQYFAWTPFELPGSHRHDWEYASVWLTNGKLTHATYSAHSRDGETKPVSDLYFDDNLKRHVKIVYHQKHFQTHCMRFARQDEKAKNELGEWITPKLVQWVMLTDRHKELLSGDWGKANPPILDKYFYNEIDKYLPQGYPVKSNWKR